MSALDTAYKPYTSAVHEIDKWKIISCWVNDFTYMMCYLVLVITCMERVHST